MSDDSSIVTYDSCRLCGHQDLKPIPVPFRWAGGNNFESVRDRIGLTQCNACKFTFTNPRPSDDVLAAHYTSDNYETHDATPRKKMGPDHVGVGIVKQFLPMTSESTFLDYGCGTGHLLYSAHSVGWKARGYDLGERAVEACRAMGLDATTSLDEIKEQRYDAIYLSHVFEHIAEHSELLEELRDMLTPGGALFIDVPNVHSLRARLSLPILSRKLRFDERYRAYPAHLSYFTVETLRRMLETRGYSVEGIVNLGLGIEELILSDDATDDGLARTAPKSSRPTQASGLKGVLASAKQAGKKAFKAAFFSLNFGENILAVAKPR